MKHYIVVKFNTSASDKSALIGRINSLFADAENISGIHGCRCFSNCIDRSNRYDLMIVLDMEKDALPAWDASALHRKWKNEYGGFVESKAIFDCED